MEVGQLRLDREDVEFLSPCKAVDYLIVIQIARTLIGLIALESKTSRFSGGWFTISVRA
jgi:hypothetical protein